MSKLKKVRCPECKRVFSVDIEAELITHQQVVLKAWKEPDMKQPKSMTVTCPNPDCKKVFIINL